MKHLFVNMRRANEVLSTMDCVRCFQGSAKHVNPASLPNDQHFMLLFCFGFALQVWNRHLLRSYCCRASRARYVFRVGGQLSIL